LDESSCESGIVCQVAVHDLDRNPTLKTQVCCEINRCHAAACDALIDLITTVNKPPNQDVTS
jgi:hypothetical protein